MATTDVRPAVNGRVIGLGLGVFRFAGGAGVAAVAAASLCVPALAGPEGAKVAAGQATITQRGQTTVIRASNNAIIDYSRFDVGVNEKVRFLQPGADSRVLNRITSDAPTRIDGSIKSNGTVYFANRAGVIFGPTAVLNVGGIVAAAGNISNRDFLAGRDRFTDLRGEVRNDGAIDARFAAFIGQSVANTGTVSVGRGVMAMVSGSEVVLSEQGGTMSVKVAPSSPGAPKAAGVGVNNSGTIDARGGRAMMVAGDMYSLAIRNTGTVRAADVRLEGRGSANVRVSGTLDAANQAGERGVRGGSVTVTGERINVAGATIDASGTRGGGTVRVGGDLQGKGDLPRAQAVTVDEATTLRADATDKGQGGRVVVWSDGATRFYGGASADGGARGGDGGLIETSGKGSLDLRGGAVSARAKAAGGKSGTWLLDPTDVTIDAAPTAGGTFSGGDPDTFTPDASQSPAVVDVATINSSLTAGTSVTITTASSGTDAGDIAVLAAIAKTGGAPATLTLDAARDIGVGAAIGSTFGALSVFLNAGRNVTVSAPVSTLGGVFTSTGVGFTVAPGGSITTGGGDVSVLHTGALSINGAIDAGALTSSSVLLRGSTLAASAPVTSGTGGITLRPDDPASAVNINNGPGGFAVSNATLANMVVPAGSALTIGVLGGTGAVGIGSGGPVDLSAADLDLTIRGGAVTLNNSITVGAARTLSFSAASIADNHTGVDVIGGALAIGTTGGASLDADVGAINDSAVGGDLTLTNAAAGPITTGALLVDGTLDLTTAGSVTLGVGSQVGNNLLVTSSGGNIALPTMNVLGGVVTLRALGPNSQVLTTNVSGSGIGPVTFNVTTVGSGSIALIDSPGDAVINATVPGTLTFNAGGDAAVNATAPLTLGPSGALGSITVTAPSLTVASLTAGTGITLQPTTDAATIGLDAPADFSVSTAQLQGLNPGAGQRVTIGRATGTGAVTIGSTAGIDLSAQGYGLTVRGGATTFNQTLTLGNDATLTLRVAGAVGHMGTDVVIGGSAGTLVLDSPSAGATLTTDVAAVQVTAPVLVLNNAGAVSISGSTGTLVVTAGGDVSVTNAQALNAAINANSGAGAISITNTGAVTVTTGNGLVGSSVSVTASDLVLTGLINASGAVTITRDTAGSIGLGDATGDMTISKAELAQITAATLTVGGGTTDLISVDNVQLADLANIGAVNLRAQATGGDVNFLGTSSTFHAVDVLADDTITFAAGQALATGGMGAGAIVLSASGGITGAGALTLNGASGLTINNDLSTMGALTARAGTGTLAVAAGATVTTNNNAATLTGNDLDLAGALTAGTASATIGRDAPGTIGLGTATGDMTIDAAELGRITAAGLTIGDARTTLLNVANVGASATGNITGTLTLLSDDIDLSGPINSSTATLAIGRGTAGAMFVGTSSGTYTLSNAELAQIVAPNLQIGAGLTNSVVVGGVDLPSTAGVAGAVTFLSTGSVTFASPASRFKTLAVRANNGVNVNANLTTTVGSIDLDGDANDQGDGSGGDRITFNAGRTLTSATDITLSASGGISGAGALTLNAGGAVNLQNSLTTAGELTVNAGGVVNIAAGSVVNSTNNAVELNGSDINLAGSINAGGGAVTIGRTHTGTIGLGTATGGITLDNGELGRIQSTGLTVGGAGVTGITVSGVTATASNSISGVTTLQAGAGAITFAGGASTFNALTALAAGAINVVSTLTADSGAIVLDSDTDGVGGEKIILTNNVRARFLPTGATTPTNAFAIDFMDDVSLAANVVVAGGNVTFHRRVDSNTATARSLVVNTFRSGDTTFRGDVGTVHALNRLTTNLDGTSRVRGRVVAARLTFNDPFRAIGDAVVESTGTSSTDGVFFNNRVDSALTGAANNLTVLAFRGTPANQNAIPVISFAGPVGATKALRNLYLNATADGSVNGRSYVPRVATIVARPRDASGNVIASPGNVGIPFTVTKDLVMGQNEKLTAAGNLVITAPRRAVLGDITTLASMNVTSPDIVIDRRAAGTILTSNTTSDGSLTTDRGVDFVANGPIAFSSVPTLAGAGAAPSFGTPTGDTGNGSTTLNGFLFQKFEQSFGAAALNNNASGSIVTLDLNPTGGSNTNIAQTIAGAVPRETRQNDVSADTTLSSAQKKEIEDLAIIPRDPTSDEFRELVAGVATFNDMPGYPATASDAASRVVVNRLTSPLVASVLEAYRALHTGPETDAEGNPVADPATGQPKQVAVSSAEIKTDLRRSVRRYREAAAGAAGAQGGQAGPVRIDPVAFRAYLEQTPAEGRSLGHLRHVQELLRRLDLLGLTSLELARARTAILRDIKPDGLTIDQLEAAARAGSPRAAR